MKTFQASIQAHESGGAFVIVPFDVEEVYGKKRVKIKASIDGAIYRGSLVRMGSPHHILLIRKDIRKKIGKEAGDVVHIILEEDTSPRIVVIPDDFKRAMTTHPDVLAFYNNLSYTHQKEYVQWIEGAKRVSTRERRIAKAIEIMKKGKKL